MDCGLVLLRGFASKNPEVNSSVFLVALAFIQSERRNCLAYWGVRGEHPYVLISPYGKRFHRVLHNFDTDQRSNRPVKTELHRRKQRVAPLRLLLLPANSKQCKG